MISPEINFNIACVLPDYTNTQLTEQLFPQLDLSGLSAREATSVQIGFFSVGEGGTLSDYRDARTGKVCKRPQTVWAPGCWFLARWVSGGPTLPEDDE